MNPIAAYTFLPWLRQGIANAITAADHDQGVHARASVSVSLQAAGDPVGGGAPLQSTVAQQFSMYGPGDITGIDARMVVRTDPHDWITNFEGNYLPAIDFYDEDFPWRYTPAAPDGSGLRLRPWITLVVLREDEFTEGKNIAGHPAPYITIPDAKVLPPADELWAWAHVHVNQLLSVGPAELVASDVPAVVSRFRSLLAANRDAAYSRLLSPRRLDDNTGYHAFVMPTFETGRLAGIGLDPGSAPYATASAWATYGGRHAPADYPYYYRWYFQTGSHGDFEYLVRLLKPQPVDKRVGVRDMDVQHPGSNLPGITAPALHGILRLGGALRVPDADLDPADLAQRQLYENWDQPYPDAFETALAAFIDLPDAYAALAPAAANAGAGIGPGIDDDPDPLVTAPLYGQWHALTRRLLTARDGSPAPNAENWVHRLNLDPRFRVPAAFGARVVETNAEEYVNYAWQQIGDVLEANSRIRRLHLAIGVSRRLHQAHLVPLAAADGERALGLLAPVSRRVLVAGKTLAFTQSASLIPPTLTSTALRRVVRPGSRMMRMLPFDANISADNLLSRVNTGEVSAAPPKAVPPGVVTVEQAAPAALGGGVPSLIARLLRRFRWLPTAVLALALLLLVIAIILLVVLPAAGAVVLAVAALAGYAWWRLRGWRTAIAREDAVTETAQTPASVSALPTSPDFVIEPPSASFRPHGGGADSPTATRFKNALRDAYTLVQAAETAAQAPAPVALKLTAVTATAIDAVDPAVTIPRRGLSSLSIPPWILGQLSGAFDEVMAYPKIDLPMYKPLKEISVELFLPNINFIAPNSLTLIETNQRFIEAYMVGLNHEFARKLLWREYRTDQRGSYFRQFWDVGSYIDSEGLSEQPLKEKLYDITELHRWPAPSALGTHNNRFGPGETGEQAVLVIRGELLKKYPNTMIFAQRAVWPRTKDGGIDLTVPRELVALTPAEEDKPPRDKLRSPLYEAKADPDIYFFGFDLTIDEAKGGTGQQPDDDPGWFFVLKQRPGEPRFGLEDERATAVLDVVDELTWQDAAPGIVAGQFLPAGALGSVALAEPSPPEPDRQAQHDDDVTVTPAAASSARWAYLLYRSPVLMAVHASEMLGQAGA